MAPNVSSNPNKQELVNYQGKWQFAVRMDNGMMRLSDGTVYDPNDLFGINKKFKEEVLNDYETRIAKYNENIKKYEQRKQEQSTMGYTAKNLWHQAAELSYSAGRQLKTAKDKYMSLFSNSANQEQSTNSAHDISNLESDKQSEARKYMSQMTELQSTVDSSESTMGKQKRMQIKADGMFHFYCHEIINEAYAKNDAKNQETIAEHMFG